jgi:hypothetical protein
MSKRVRSRNYFVYPIAFDTLLWRSGMRTDQTAKLLGRTTRTIQDWRAGNRPVPRWAFQLVQLMLAERYDQWRVLPAPWVFPGDHDLRPIIGTGVAQNDASYPQADGPDSDAQDDIATEGKPVSANDLFLNRQAQRPMPAAQASDRRPWLRTSDAAPGYPQAGLARATEAQLAGPWITLLTSFREAA